MIQRSVDRRVDQWRPRREFRICAEVNSPLPRRLYSHAQEGGVVASPVVPDPRPPGRGNGRTRKQEVAVERILSARSVAAEPKARFAGKAVAPRRHGQRERGRRLLLRRRLGRFCGRGRGSGRPRDLRADELQDEQHAVGPGQPLLEVVGAGGRPLGAGTLLGLRLTDGLGGGCRRWTGRLLRWSSLPSLGHGRRARRSPPGAAETS